MLERLKELKVKATQKCATAGLALFTTMQVNAEGLMDDQTVDDAIQGVSDNLFPVAVALLVISIGWGIAMWASLVDSRRWYFPIIGIAVAFFLGDGFTEAVDSLRSKYEG